MRTYAQKQNPLQPKRWLQPATKLAVSAPGDRYEQEADHIAERVMRLSEPGIQRACACGGACPACQPSPDEGQEALPIRRVEAGGPEPGAIPFLATSVLRSPGQPLDAATREFMEPRFGHDFSRVRIHADADAARSAQEINAHAYTYGSDIVFASGRYQPATAGGRRLLSHELAHVVQQGGSAPRQLQRQEEAPEVPMAAVKRDAPKAKSWKGASSACGTDFCSPLPSEGMAMDSRRDLWSILMVGIGIKVGTRVLSLWNTWAFGGSSSIQDLSKTFGADFTNSATTADTTDFLMKAIKAKLTASPPTIPASGFVKLDIPTLIPTEVKALDDPTGSDQMNFNVIGEIPGNIAGGIGKDQAANPVGANPSPQDDARIAKGSVTVFDTGTNLLAMPDINYTVKDTVDLCPGNCGSSTEQIATVPMSVWEATGISGDVPYTVDFPAPALRQMPFNIPKPAAPKSAPTTPPKSAPTTSPPTPKKP